MAMSDGDYVTHEECSESSRRVLEKLDSIERRLFRDNGSVSIQTRLDRHEQILRALLWVVGLLVGAGVTAGVSCAVVIVKQLLENGGAA